MKVPRNVASGDEAKTFASEIACYRLMWLSSRSRPKVSSVIASDARPIARLRHLKSKTLHGSMARLYPWTASYPQTEWATTRS